MERWQVVRPAATARSTSRACLVAGCPCMDARIVSQRRVAFFAAWAKDHGETADRSIEPDPTWSVACARPPSLDSTDGGAPLPHDEGTIARTSSGW